MGTVKAIYEHNHQCSRRGERQEVRPEIRDGLVFLVHPRCVEVPGSELMLVEVVSE